MRDLPMAASATLHLIHDAIGAMHEHLYKMGAASTVEISTYLRTLLEDQQAAFGSGETSRTITLEADQVHWPSSEAPALGMIVGSGQSAPIRLHGSP